MILLTPCTSIKFQYPMIQLPYQTKPISPITHKIQLQHLINIQVKTLNPRPESPSPHCNKKTQSLQYTQTLILKPSSTTPKMAPNSSSATNNKHNIHQTQNLIPLRKQHPKIPPKQNPKE
ncbi:hypothetical protein M758_6G074900 [Ceratodon purpureus]|nr:hypothetical protein M758_6G074900 [Ceratodon purpureus]